MSELLELCELSELCNCECYGPISRLVRILFPISLLIIVIKAPLITIIQLFQWLMQIRLKMYRNIARKPINPQILDKYSAKILAKSVNNSKNIIRRIFRWIFRFFHFFPLIFHLFFGLFGFSNDFQCLQHFIKFHQFPTIFSFSLSFPHFAQFLVTIGQFSKFP